MMSACRHYVTDKPKHKHKWAHTCLRLRGSKWDEKSRWENFDIAVICCGAHLGASLRYSFKGCNFYEVMRKHINKSIKFD